MITRNEGGLDIHREALLLARPEYGLPYSLWDKHSASPYETCAACGQSLPNVASHHDHFLDLVDRIAVAKQVVLDENPQTFPRVVVCAPCNGLCPKFKAKHKLAPSFFSLSPTDMRDFLDGRDVLEQVQDRYREPFRYWARKLDAMAEMRVAALTRHRPGSHLHKPIKRERQVVLDTLDTNPHLRAAYDSKNLPECHAIASDLLEDQWTREVFHSFAHLLWFTTHKGHANSGVFAEAFKKGDLRYAKKVFDQGC